MRLLKNFWLKVFALVMGFLVWFHVATEKTYNYELSLPIMEVVLKDSLTLSRQPPESLLVEVSAKGKQLLRKMWRERGVRVNATHYQAGRYTITFSPNNTSLVGPQGDISLEEIVFPRQVELYIDHVGSVPLHVIPNIDVQPDDGFAIRSISVAPPGTALLTGPRSSLASFSSVSTAKRHLSSLRNSISIVLPVVVPSDFGYSVDPDSVTVEIEVVPVKTRVYDNLPVVIFNLPPRISAVTEPTTVQVELTGPPQDIDLLNRNALVLSVDYRQANTGGRAPLKIDCPSNFHVKRSSVDSVRIVVASDADSGN